MPISRITYFQRIKKRPTNSSEKSSTMCSKKKYSTREVFYHPLYDASKGKRLIKSFVKFTKEFIVITLVVQHSYKKC